MCISGAKKVSSTIRAVVALAWVPCAHSLSPRMSKIEIQRFDDSEESKQSNFNQHCHEHDFS